MCIVYKELVFDDFIVTSDLTFEERNRCRDEAEMMLNKILALEGSPLFTQNVQFLEDREKHWRSRYMQHSSSSPVSSYGSPVYGAASLDFPLVQNPVPSPLLHTFPKLVYDAAIDGTQATWGTDEEIKVMANVMAYFEVAHRVSVL